MCSRTHRSMPSLSLFPFLFFFRLAWRRSSPAERRYLSMLMSSLTWKEGTSGRPAAEAASVVPPPARGIVRRITVSKGEVKFYFFFSSIFLFRRRHSLLTPLLFLSSPDSPSSRAEKSQSLLVAFNQELSWCSCTLHASAAARRKKPTSFLKQKKKNAFVCRQTTTWPIQNESPFASFSTLAPRCFLASRHHRKALLKCRN